MKLTGIHIEQFGRWDRLDLNLGSQPLSVFYGPNETGKSTLLRFIREMLYGTDSDGLRGELAAEHHGRALTIRRDSAAGIPLTVDDAMGDAAEHQLTTLLSGTEQALFEQVFAIGLAEIQQLATLDSADVSRRIYDMTLGPDARRLLAAEDRLAAHRDALFNPATAAGSLEAAADRHRGSSADLDELKARHASRTRLAQRLTQLHQELADQKARRDGLQQQLEGCRLLDRIHEPWRQQREIDGELELLGSPVEITVEQVEKFQATEQRLAAYRDRHDALRQELKDVRSEVSRLSTASTLIEAAPRIELLTDLRGSVTAAQERLKTDEPRLRQCEAEARTGRQRLGDRYDSARLADPLPDDLLTRLTESARSYRAQSRRRKRLVSRYRSLSSSLSRRQASLADRCRKIGVEDAATAARELRKRIALLTEIVERQQRVQLLKQQRESLFEQLDAEREERRLPRFFYAVLAAFAVLGAVLLIAGLTLPTVTDGPHAWLVGGIYLLTGVSAAGVSWTLHRRFRTTDETRRFAIEDRLRNVEIELRETEQDIGRLAERAGAEDAQPTENQPRTDLIRLRDAHRELAEAEALAVEQEKLIALRKRLTQWRVRIRERGRQLANTRRRWCERLRELGLAETLNTRSAIETAQQVINLHALHREVRFLEHAVQLDRDLITRFHKLMETVAQTLGEPYRRETAGELRDRWTRGLEEVRHTVEQKRALRERYRQLRRELMTLERRRKKAAAKRNQLLAALEIADADELEQRLDTLAKRDELCGRREQFDRQLDELMADYPDIAIVEDDLVAFSRAANDECIEAVELELLAIEDDIEQTNQQQGAIRQQLDELAADERLVSAEFDTEQAAREWEEAALQWQAGELAAQAMTRLRERIEDREQPTVLRDASLYLAKLTCGRYRRVWTPLGERRLIVDDATDQPLTTEQLSRGTREQLFLAVRLAVVRKLAAGGLELPMVLDDVLVNFDQERTEAAVGTLLDVAAEGQQILLFTCHQHLANTFAAAGAEPVQLPQNGRLLRPEVAV